MLAGPHDVALNFARSLSLIVRTLWYSPVLYLTIARLFA